MVHRLKKETANYEQSTTNRKSKGFTLVELLVVIAITATLMGIGAFAYSTSQQKVRDSKRKEDLRTVKTAMELARLDCDSKSYYPYQSADVPHIYKHYDQLMGILTGNQYLNKAPRDPKEEFDNNANSLGLYSYAYAYNSPDIDETVARCPGPKPGIQINQWVIVARIERGDKDLDAARSKAECASQITNSAVGAENPAGAFFYVCASGQ